MIKNEFPKTLKFKKITESEKIVISSGYASNKHWIFSIEWLKSLKPSSRALGFSALRNRVVKSQQAAIIARLKDQKYPSFDLEGLVAKINLATFSEVKEFQFNKGYVKGNLSNYDVAYLSFTHVWAGNRLFTEVKDSPSLDVEYSAALFFDDSTKIFIHTSSSPVAIVSQNKIVGLLSPLSPELLKGEK